MQKGPHLAAATKDFSCLYLLTAIQKCALSAYNAPGIPLESVNTEDTKHFTYLQPGSQEVLLITLRA